MDIKALQLASRFALPPNSLGYCGRDSAPERFKSCVIHEKCDDVADEIKKFIVLYPYLKTISSITKLPKFSHKVIEAYWLGNTTLSHVKNKDYLILLQNLARQGVPTWLIDELKDRRPKTFIPTHLFQVLHVGVGRASGSVKYNLESINNCMIRWGVVEKMQKSTVDVVYNQLALRGGKYRLVQEKERLPFIPGFLPEVEKGDIVAAHWKQIVKKLDDNEVQNITVWTNKVLDVIN